MAKLERFAWWQWFVRPTWKLISTVEAADEVPANIPPHGIILVGDQKYPKWLVFDCPCQMGHRIMLNLDPDRFPTWHFTIKPRLSIWPSIDYQGPQYRCHYLIRKGQVQWVNSEETEA